LSYGPPINVNSIRHIVFNNKSPIR
jgi:hypothetical protein